MACNLNINWVITDLGSKNSKVDVTVNIEGPWVDVNLLKLSQNQMVKKLDGITTVLVR
jgi:formiminotetrahydrofolate cyclodeaminase